MCSIYMLSIYTCSGCSQNNAWTKLIVPGLIEQLRLERISGGLLVQPPLLKQGQVIRSANVICNMNNPITYGKVTM